MFILHPQLEKDCHLVHELPLSLVLLMDDSQFPWLIQVPKVADISEVIELDEQQQILLWQESSLLDRTLQALYQPDKLNLAALGNMVPQLHIHHIARFRNDIAWPGPIWGKATAKPYSNEKLSNTITELQQFISENSKKERLC